MKITVFTCNQARHISLIESLQKIAREVFVVQEVSTVFPGQVDDFYKKSEVMQTYFSKVISAEREVFGHPRVLSGNVHHLPIRSGDLNHVPMDWLNAVFESDVYLVFGGSYIRGELCDRLIQNKALNIHMGVSPYYRGSSCNFWPLYDKRPDLVGATVHLLSSGLDSGSILFHALPRPQPVDGFLLGMLAVKAAHQALVQTLSSGELGKMVGLVQDKTREVRYTRNAQFTDSIASEYLERAPSAAQIQTALDQRRLEEFVNPILI